MKTMGSDRNFIYYACIAKGTTILAEFNSKDADLGALALKCLDKTPSHHVVFSHTVRNRTHLFLIDDPFSYFAIFDENLENSEGLAFLKNVKDAFNADNNNSGKKRLESLSSHCFQGEFNPVFRQLLVSNEEMEGFHSPRTRTRSLNYNSKGNRGNVGGGGKPLLGDIVNCLKKKKRTLLGDCDGGASKNNKDDGMSEKGSQDDMSIKLSREFSIRMHKNGGLYSSEFGRLKGKNVWKKHVWLVLSMDFIICTILFMVWLCICRGFKCINA